MASQIRLFVGNLPENIEDRDLNSAFSSFGKVVNVDVKKTSGDESNKKNFAFVTLSATNYEVESCIKHFSNQDFHGKTLNVTRARESFLERLQRERQQEQDKLAAKKDNILPTNQPVLNLGDNLNPRKRKLDKQIKDTVIDSSFNSGHTSEKHVEKQPESRHGTKLFSDKDKKKQDADQKRMESMRKKRQEFKEKRTIIKTSLIGIDKAANKKVIFSDDEDTPPPQRAADAQGKPQVVHKTAGDTNHTKNRLLFEDDDGSGEDVSFDIREQFEGKKGQKVLDLQSRYKSDKRFVLDERFIGDDETDGEEGQEADGVDLQQQDERTKQLNILQDVLGVAIKSHSSHETNNKKAKMGMLRFDPTQPEHAKFFAPVEEKPDQTKKNKKKKNKDQQQLEIQPEPSTQPEPPKIEVSKETFYKVSETLKETIAQPTSFSLRSLFGSKENDDKDTDATKEQDTGYIPLETPNQPKVKNPFDPGERNPFMYDSSDSEEEKEEVKDVVQPEKTEVAAVWKENLFFTDSDYRLKEGLAFFNKPIENEGQKERRELKSLMKKRLYNNERKNQMFQKKIGGRKKIMKKSYNNENRNNKR